MSENTTGAAIQARRESSIKSVSPERLSAVDLRGEVSAVRETADLYKVYVPEWLTVFTSTTVGASGLAECQAYYAETFQGRVRDEDVTFRPSSEVLPEEFSYTLALRLPNIKGEFKYRELAEAYVADNSLDGAVIVARNSRDEFKLKDYSVKRLAGQA